MAESVGTKGPTGSGGFQPAHLTAIIVAIVVSVAIVGAALLVRTSPSPAPAKATAAPFSQSAEEIACLQGGGTWYDPFIYGYSQPSCRH